MHNEGKGRRRCVSGMFGGRFRKGGAMDIKLYRCTHCGNIAIKVVDSGVAMVCCGNPMVELVAGETDGVFEKHVPCVEVEGNAVNVQVGEVVHPMSAAHYIQFIVLVTTHGCQVASLTPNDNPLAMFSLAEDEMPVKVYEYCNLHGLWVKEL